MINLYYASAILSVTIASFSQILLKKGAMQKYDSVSREYMNGCVITGYLMMFVSVFLTMMAYRGMNFMNVPVIEAFGYVLVPVLSYFFFKEGFSKRKVIGIVCILMGIFVYYSA